MKRGLKLFAAGVLWGIVVGFFVGKALSVYDSVVMPRHPVTIVIGNNCSRIHGEAMPDGVGAVFKVICEGK